MSERVSRRIERDQRRNLNAEEMFAMGFAELQENADEDGWAYADDDDSETTESYMRMR